MASAFPEFDDISERSEPSEPCVEPKIKKNSSVSESDDIRTKAYVPKSLPKDFLRVMLNEQQVNETTDEELARRLQFGLTKGAQRMQKPAMNNINYLGRLQIDIVEAVLNKNYGLVKMDPYVKMTIATKNFETATDYSGAKNPRWNKSILCYIPKNVDNIKFEIYDEKSFTDDELIAVVKFPLPESLFKSGLVDEWLPLSGKLGEQKEGSIRIRLSFMPIDKVMESEQNYYRPNNSPNMNEIPGLYSYPPQQQMQPQIQNIDEDLNRALQISASELAKSSNSEVDLKNLKDMFPDFEFEVIKSLLEANKGNKEATIESILEMSGDN